MACFSTCCWSIDSFQFPKGFPYVEDLKSRPQHLHLISASLRLGPWKRHQQLMVSLDLLLLGVSGSFSHGMY